MGKYYSLDSSKFKYTCETCGKKIKSPQSLELHNKMHLKNTQVTDVKLSQVAKEDVQVSQTSENSNKLVIAPESIDNKIEVPTPEEDYKSNPEKHYKYHCENCDSYFNEFENGYECPSCNYDFSHLYEDYTCENCGRNVRYKQKKCACGLSFNWE